MDEIKMWSHHSAVVLILLVSGCRNEKTAPGNSEEHPVQILPLDRGEDQLQRDELSGLAWFGEDTLVLLPQLELEPPEIQRAKLYVFTATRQAIRSAIATGRKVPLKEVPVHVSLPKSIEGYDGFEAITFAGDRVYASVEIRAPEALGVGKVAGCVLAGTTKSEDGVLESITFDQLSRVIPAQVPEFESYGYEALLLEGDRLLTFYEANGELATHGRAPPYAECMSTKLERAQPFPVPTLEYRLTDVTASIGGVFWAINYQFPGRAGDQDVSLRTTDDPIAAAHPRGRTHAKSAENVETMVVERLVEMRVDAANHRIRLTDTPPIQLVLGAGSRNWEGIVRLPDPDGFLLVADQFTIENAFLVFVPRTLR